MDGISTNTPKNIIFGAGTIHKGLKYENSAWNFTSTVIGATEGGTTLTITPEYKTIEADNASVKVSGLTVKVGEVATLQTTFLELTKDIIKTSAFGKTDTTDVTGYSKIVSKDKVESSDYLENIAFVGETLDGKHVIAILENALCTSGVELSGSNKNEITMSATFECHASLTGDHTLLPWKIYFED